MELGITLWKALKTLYSSVKKYQDIMKLKLLPLKPIHLI